MGIPSISEDGRRIAAVVAFMSACALWRLALTFSRLHDCCSREEGKKSSIYTSDPAAAATTRLPSQLFFFSLLFLFAALFSLSFFSFSSSELLQTYCMHACIEKLFFPFLFHMFASTPSDHQYAFARRRPLPLQLFSAFHIHYQCQGQIYHEKQNREQQSKDG